MQIKTTVRYYLTPVRMATIIKQQTTSIGKNVEKKGTLVHCQWELSLVRPLRKTTCCPEFLLGLHKFHLSSHVSGLSGDQLPSWSYLGTGHVSIH